ncbi:hypothetical protein LPB67_18565, partial [Undibacterium sp. Jales W-56]|uniref:hypothetical protein n=1 Tax=Undibacterium sp. Jales W-56 TaxID=2897325 RepID=UPI0021CE778C
WVRIVDFGAVVGGFGGGHGCVARGRACNGGYGKIARCGRAWLAISSIIGTKCASFIDQL